jgi:hypothetical protein
MWKLKKFHRVGELTASIAVVISLTFVGIEIAQNNKLNIETSTQRLVSELRGIQHLLSDNAEFACIYTKGMQDYLSLSGSHRIRYSAYHLSTFQVYQEMYLLMQRERIEPEIWAGVHSALFESMQLRGIQEWFATRRHWFGNSFQEYIVSLPGKFALEKSVIYDDPACSTSGGI